MSPERPEEGAAEIAGRHRESRKSRPRRLLLWRPAGLIDFLREEAGGLPSGHG